MLRDALVVGISSYQYLPALNAPAHDAEAIAHQLEQNGDFRVTRLPEIVQAEKLRVGVTTPVSLAQLEAALVKLFKPKGSNVPHTALFYYSGHGLQKEAGISEGYLATSDANPNAHFYGLSLFWLRRLLQESPVRQRIVLLDCCHSGEILNYLEADPGAKTGTDRLFMAASREYETAYESLTGQYSIFTQALLEGLDARRLPNGIVTNYALTDWVSNALKGESQQPLFENSGSEIVLTRCQSPLTILQSATVQEICPYRGLEPFDESHAEYFFGRESLTDQLVDKLRTGNFVAVVGASGSGKSSLVKAGLIHKLRRGHALSGSDRWQIRVITPTDHPFKSLANAFVSAETSAVDRAEQLHRAETFLQEGAMGLTQLVRASLISENRSTRLLLIIDQFEEIFTLCQGGNAERDRHRFFQSLLTSLQNLPDQFSLVLALRADFFGKCSFYTGLAEQIEHQLVMVTPLSYDQIKASILKPAEKVGLVCDPNLVYNILMDIVGAPGELPLLQYTLLELWQRREKAVDGGAARLTLDAYAELGGVRGTLQKRANEIFYSLSPEEQCIAKRIFVALTQLGEGTEDTRRRVLKSELIHAKSAAGLVEQVLEKLVVAKLVVTNQIHPTSNHQNQVTQRFANVSTALRLAQVVKSKSAHSSELAQTLPSNKVTLNQKYNLNVTRISHTTELNEVSSALGNTCQETVDIAHEALIRNWGLLRTWLDENREMLRRQRRIERAAREWSRVQEVRTPEYLMRGSRLLDAEDFFNQYPDELSSLAQRYITASRDANRRTRRELRFLQVSVPCTLILALGVTFGQYRMAAENRAEKNYQLEVATSRQWSAIAQSLLQEADHDPSTALLISRMAAERARTYEAETSLRSALQGMQLQAHWHVSEKPIEQVVFSPNRDWLATVDTDGHVALSSLQNQHIKRVLRKPDSSKGQSTARSSSKMTIAFSQDGRYLAVHSGTATVQVWSVADGELRNELGGLAGTVTQVAVSSRGNRIALTNGNSIQVWDFATGLLQSQGTYPTKVQAIQLSSNGTRLLVADSRSVSIIQVNGYRLERRLRLESAIAAVRLSPTSQLVAIANSRGSTQLWNTANGKLQQTIQPLPRVHQGAANLAVSQLVFSPNEERLAIVNASGQVQVLQLQTRQHWHIEQSARKVDENKRETVTLAFSPSGQHLVITGHSPLQSNQIATLRDAATGDEVSRLRGASDAVNTLQFSPDGALVATASMDGAVQLWTTEIGSELASLKLTSEPIQWAHFQFSPDVKDGSLPASALGQSAEVAKSLNFPDRASEKIVAIGRDGAFQQWTLIEPLLSSWDSEGQNFENQASLPQRWGQKLIKPLKQIGHWIGLVSHALDHPTELPFAINSVSSPDGSPAASAPSLEHEPSQPIATLVMSTASEENLSRLMGVKGQITATMMSRDGTLMAIATNEGLVEVWQRPANRPPRLIARLQEATPSTAKNRLVATIHYLEFSPNNQKLLGVGVDRTLRLWDLDTNRLINQFVGHEALAEQAHFSPDGSKIVSASWDRTVRLWDVASGQLLNTLTQPDVATSAHFSSDGQRLLITSLDSTARVLDATTGAMKVILAGHRGAVLEGDFSPDGNLIVTASADGSAKLWNAHTGVELTALRVGKQGDSPQAIKKAFFSPNGQHVATLSTNGTVHLWIATWAGLLEVARDRSLRQLKPDECLRYLRLAPNACPSLRLGQQ